MPPEQVCFPYPLGCFPLPQTTTLPHLPGLTDEDYADECILSNASIVAKLWSQDPPNAFPSLADLTGDDD